VLTDARRRSGTLETINSPPHQFSSVTFESNVDSTGSVYFLQANGTAHQFSFTLDGFLAYKGDADHWTQCVGELEQTVVCRIGSGTECSLTHGQINYNGTDSSCEHVYIFQEKTPAP
jgi:hypothetical protein